MTKWTYFVGAALFAGYCLFRIGVPLSPILGGCFLAGLVHWLRRRRSGSLVG